MYCYNQNIELVEKKLMKESLNGLQRGSGVTQELLYSCGASCGEWATTQELGPWRRLASYVKSIQLMLLIDTSGR